MFVKHTIVALLLASLCLANAADPPNGGNNIGDGIECAMKMLAHFLECGVDQKLLESKQESSETCCAMYKSIHCVKEKAANDAKCKNSIVEMEDSYKEGGKCAKYHCNASANISVNLFLAISAFVFAYLFAK